MITLACSDAPEGYERWALRLLADELVALEVVELRFDPAEARRIASKTEWHDTPERGSWLSVAECELSVLRRQRLKGRPPTIERVET